MVGVSRETGLSRRRMLQLLGVTAGAAGTTVTAKAAAVAAPEETLGRHPDPMADSAAKVPAQAPEISKVRGNERVLTANFKSRGLLGPQVDEWVLAAQRWVNQTYSGTPGFVPVEETGRTGWPTMFALTRALQIELGLNVNCPILSGRPRCRC
jgi:hypothetical protein